MKAKYLRYSIKYLEARVAAADKMADVAEDARGWLFVDECAGAHDADIELTTALEAYRSTQ